MSMRRRGEATANGIGLEDERLTFGLMMRRVKRPSLFNTLKREQ